MGQHSISFGGFATNSKLALLIGGNWSFSLKRIKWWDQEISRPQGTSLGTGFLSCLPSPRSPEITGWKQEGGCISPLLSSHSLWNHEGPKHSSWSVWKIMFCLFRDGSHNNVAFWKLFFFLSLFMQSALSWTGLSEAQADFSSTHHCPHPHPRHGPSPEPWISTASSVVLTLHCALPSRVWKPFLLLPLPAGIPKGCQTLNCNNSHQKVL